MRKRVVRGIIRGMEHYKKVKNTTYSENRANPILYIVFSVAEKFKLLSIS